MTVRIYVGLPLTGTASPYGEVFRSAVTPTADTYGDRFAAVVGPFRTIRGAQFMAQHGRGNPHLQTVADAERLAGAQPAPYGVRVTFYRLSPGVNTTNAGIAYRSEHRSAAAAARHLASIIAGQSAIAREVRRAIPRDMAGRYGIVVESTGENLALTPFRARFCTIAT